MIIDRPRAEDIDGLRHLWQQAFGDTDAYLDIFFRVGFAPERCRCIRHEKAVTAALYWFDCSWGNKKIAYIYAVATDKSYRGQGLCRSLMESTHKQLQKEGYNGAVLVPVKPELSNMYAKFGYRGFCPLEKATGEKPQATAISPEEYGVLRQTHLGENAVLHGSTALKLLDTYGDFYKTETAAFCGYRENDTFHFEEIIGQLPAQREAFSEAMYLGLDNSDASPGYFAIPLN